MINRGILYFLKPKRHIKMSYRKYAWRMTNRWKDDVWYGLMNKMKCEVDKVCFVTFWGSSHPPYFLSHFFSSSWERSASSSRNCEKHDAIFINLHLLDIIKKNDQLQILLHEIHKLRLESIIQLFRLICNDILQKENFLQNLVVLVYRRVGQLPQGCVQKQTIKE